MNVKTIENSVKKVDTLFECENCEFKTTSKQGLKTHIKRKHITYETFPTKCVLCESNLNWKEELLKHMPSHSYNPSSELNFKCEECDFWGPNQLTMEVHVGKHHSERFECGLCDNKGKNFDDLEIHLVTCELYRCPYCLCSSFLLRDITFCFLFPPAS